MRVYRSTVTENYETLLPMLKEHWDEIGRPKKNLELKVDTNLYKILEDTGRYLGFCIEHEGEIIGYLSMFIFNHQHHADTLFATTDCFFVRKKYRSIKSYRAVCEMFKLAEETLKHQNVQYMQMAFSVKNDLSNLAKHLGFEQSEVLYCKKIK